MTYRSSPAALLLATLRELLAEPTAAANATATAAAAEACRVAAEASAHLAAPRTRHPAPGAPGELIKVPGLDPSDARYAGPQRLAPVPRRRPAL